jgi:hypothetical protein
MSIMIETFSTQDLFVYFSNLTTKQHCYFKLCCNSQHKNPIRKVCKKNNKIMTNMIENSISLSYTKQVTEKPSKFDYLLFLIINDEV